MTMRPGHHRNYTTLTDVTTRTLAADNPLRESLAHGLVLNMHRAQGLTVDRAITVMDSHDRLLNSKSLFYVLSSRAREHLGLHVDSKEKLADAIGKHRGDVPHAREVAGEARNTPAVDQHGPGKASDKEAGRSPEIELQIDITKGLRKAFEIGL